MPLDPISGRPGTTFVNETKVVLYQFSCSFINTCGYCLSFHGQVGPLWPIPMHRACRCYQTPVFPGESAPMPFVNVRTLAKKLPPDQRAALFGANLWRLYKARVVPWDDMLTDSRVRSLAEVVALLGLSVKRMTKAGIPLFIARRAEEDAKKPPAEIEAERRESVRRRLEEPEAQSRSVFDDLIRAGAGATLAGGFLSTSHGRRQADELAALLAEPGSR